jgi:hypothetical protein
MPELVMAIEDLYLCSKKENDWRYLQPPYPECILQMRCIFWSVIYHVQKEVPKTGRRLHYAEMLQQIQPEINWDFLMPDRKTRASKEK